MKDPKPNDTQSVCPVCLRKIDATRLSDGEDVFLVKSCPEHGAFKTVLWRGEPTMEAWRRPKEVVHPQICYGAVEKGCPFDCGLCAAHEQYPCSVFLEVTDRCNLRCAVCFADSGRGETGDPTLAAISGRLERAMAAVGACNLQLSGGEPTLRDDLPEIVRAAKRIGYSFIQVNTNGLHLAADAGYAKRLSAAGLSSVFLQFDAADDEVYRLLRGRSLLEEKLRAVRNCGEAGLGVILVPTLVKGVNTGLVGQIVQQALQLAPIVRGVHFQPLSYFGRFPVQNRGEGRFTLPELMRALEEQTEGLMKVVDFSPPGCEHERCSFHAAYLYSADGAVRPVGGDCNAGCCSADRGEGGVAKTVESVSRRWRLDSGAAAPKETCCGPEKPKLLPFPGKISCSSGNNQKPTRIEEALDLDLFLKEAASRSFTLSAMAFQDADNLDLERLRGCCISVIAVDGRLIPFCAYNLTGREGKRLYSRKG